MAHSEQHRARSRSPRKHRNSRSRSREYGRKSSTSPGHPRRSRSQDRSEHGQGRSTSHARPRHDSKSRSRSRQRDWHADSSYRKRSRSRDSRRSRSPMHGSRDTMHSTRGQSSEASPHGQEKDAQPPTSKQDTGSPSDHAKPSGSPPGSDGSGRKNRPQADAGQPAEAMQGAQEGQAQAHGPLPKRIAVPDYALPEGPASGRRSGSGPAAAAPAMPSSSGAAAASSGGSSSGRPSGGSRALLSFADEMEGEEEVVPSRKADKASKALPTITRLAAAPVIPIRSTHITSAPPPSSAAPRRGLVVYDEGLRASGSSGSSRGPSPEGHRPGAAGAAAPALSPRRGASMERGRADSDSGLSTSSSGGGPGRGRGNLGRIVFGVAQARCARPYMEDRHCIVASLRPLASSGKPIEDGVDRCFVGVYDGHNGSRTAEVAAARLHVVVASDPALRLHTGEAGPPAMQAAEEQAIRAALRKAFREVDNSILKQARADGGRDGSTALVVMRMGDTLYAAHAGDSRAVMSRGGKAERLTEDHKPSLASERSRVEAIGGRIEFQRCWRVVVEPRDGRPGSGLAVSRSLGDLDFKEPRRLVESDPDVRRVLPRPCDAFVVLASDGLWDVMSDQDAVDVVGASLQSADSWRSGGTTTTAEANAAAEAALNLAVKRRTVDNVTVVVMVLQWS